MIIFLPNNGKTEDSPLDLELLEPDFDFSLFHWFNLNFYKINFYENQEIIFILKPDYNTIQPNKSSVKSKCYGVFNFKK